MVGDPRLRKLMHMLTTATVGMLLPAFKEEFGESTPINLIGTLSQSFISEKVENVAPSGITIDKNGNLKLNINAGAQIIVEKSRDKWEDARAFYLTATAKAKIAIDTSDPENKTLTITPKALELSMFKVFHGDEEMSLEQMLV